MIEAKKKFICKLREIVYKYKYYNMKEFGSKLLNTYRYLYHAISEARNISCTVVWFIVFFQQKSPIIAQNLLTQRLGIKNVWVARGDESSST